MKLHNPDITLDSRWARVAARDKAADGAFWYSVRTTGVYCRPSCPSRLANPKNVQFHDSVSAAEAAGFRPCRRCNPNGISIDAANAAIVTKACRLIDEASEPLSLAQLAQSVELSPYYFHRLFKQITGLTPKAYAAAGRSARLRARLAKAPTITEAFHEAGFGSNGRFYEASAGLLGMSPSQYRSGGAHEVLTFAVGQCSLGAILVASSVKGVAAILLGDDPEVLVRDLQDRFPSAQLIGADAAYELLVAQVVGLVEAPARGLALPLDVRGTAFQQRVWLALRAIPPGQTATYSSIAKKIGSPQSVRAVAGACAANPIAVAIPCHRVVRHDGGLSGYRWGVERKRELLARVRSKRPSLPGEGGVRRDDLLDEDVAARVRRIDVTALEHDLDAQGWSVISDLLKSRECDDIAALYDEQPGFRSHVVMARHGFGQGEYRYFSYPLPPLVQQLRKGLYPQLEPIANRWHARMGLEARFPATHDEFIARCAASGQCRPTPLLLNYGADDYNCLHQDLYGEHVFPLQVAVLLSEPATDFTGGEFVLTEQRPRMQTRAAVVPLAKGDAVVFAVNSRPVHGTRGDYRVKLRHGVSKIIAGHRRTLGIIFHDAS